MVLHIFGGEVPGGNATTLWDSPPAVARGDAMVSGFDHDFHNGSANGRAEDS